MTRQEKIDLGKKIVELLSSQGANIKESAEILSFADNIIKLSVVDIDAIKKFKDWFS